MWAYLTAVWRCRHFWLSLVALDLQARYRRSIFGIGWSLLHPIATALVMCTVFAGLFHLDLCDFVPFLLSGLAFWAYFLGVTLQGCQCFLDAEAYIRQHPLPMAVYPLRTTLRALIDLGIALGIVILVTGLWRGFVDAWPLLCLVPAAGLLLVLGWALATVAGFVNTVFRDIRLLSEVGLQVFYYLTPIVYHPEFLLNSRMAWLVYANPLVPFLNLIRLPLLESTVPTWRTFAAATAVTVLAAAMAAALLRQVQRRVILYM
jgi:ABC-type polysaccharide/polyol phosphate export permease